MKKNSISLPSQVTLAHNFMPQLVPNKLHQLPLFTNGAILKKTANCQNLTCCFYEENDPIQERYVNKNRSKLNNPQNNAFRVVSTKTGSSETTTITVKDIISSNLSYSQSNFSINSISPANYHYAVLSDRKDLRSKKFVTQKSISINSTVKVRTQRAQHICKSQSNIIAHPAISQKSEY